MISVCLVWGWKKSSEMPNSWFQFKKFIVRQNRTAMKVGTDSVLLGSWCSLKNAMRILDVGAGTGIIAMMTAQRSQASIDTLEIDEEAFRQAEENVRQSIFAERICVHHVDYLCFAKSCNTQYDTIVSNPPYFDNSLQPENMSRSIARHSETLSLKSLIETSAKLLSKHGIISIIIPISKEVEARQIAENCGLAAKRSLYVRGTPDKPVKRVLIEWTRSPEQSEKVESLTVSEKNKYSAAYVKLTKDFYMDL